MKHSGGLLRSLSCRHPWPDLRPAGGWRAAVILLAAAGCTPEPPLPETLPADDRFRRLCNAGRSPRPADEHRHRVSLRQLGRHLEQARRRQAGIPPAAAATRR